MPKRNRNEEHKNKSSVGSLPLVRKGKTETVVEGKKFLPQRQGGQARNWEHW